MKYIKKLSVKTVYGRPTFEKGAPDDTVIPIMQVFGQATGVKSGTSAFGEWEALTGTFEATNVETGETYRSGTLFLPDIAHQPIAAALKTSSTVDFAIEIIAYKDSSTAVGYQYGMNSLVEVEASDPIRMLREKAQKSLPAPQKEAAESVTKEEKAAPAKKK